MVGVNILNPNNFEEIAGFWYKESDDFKNNFEYLYIKEDGSSVVSSVLLSVEPLKVAYIYASLEIIDSKIMATNKRTRTVNENYFSYTSDSLSWSIDGIEFRTWKRVAEDNIFLIPQEIISQSQ